MYSFGPISMRHSFDFGCATPSGSFGGDTSNAVWVEFLALVGGIFEREGWEVSDVISFVRKSTSLDGEEAEEDDDEASGYEELLLNEASVLVFIFSSLEFKPSSSFSSSDEKSSKLISSSSMPSSSLLSSWHASSWSLSRFFVRFGGLLSSSLVACRARLRALLPLQMLLLYALLSFLRGYWRWRNAPAAALVARGRWTRGGRISIEVMRIVPINNTLVHNVAASSFGWDDAATAAGVRPCRYWQSGMKTKTPKQRS